MQRFWPTLRGSYAYGFGGLIVGSYAGSVILAFGLATDEGVTLERVVHAPLSGFVVALFAFAFGVVPAVLFCIPAYAALRYWGLASYWTALLVGLAPGGLIVAVWEQPTIGALFAGYGALAGLLTHYFTRVALAAAMHNAGAPKL